MMTVKEMHAGDGFAYLLRGVADSVGGEGAMSQMTRYYSAEGNPPGTWLGAGLTGLDGGRGLAVGSVVSSDQMELLFKHGFDPVSGAVLGRRNRIRVPLRDRVAARVAELDASLDADQRAAAVADIEAEELARPQARSVAGFDFTFSAPKSVSTLWALADAGVREQMYEAHRAAVEEVVSHFEREVARTRIGTDGAAQVEVRGVIAAAFDHWDNRNGDPHLHTHVVIANRVQAEDGKWRTLDSLGSIFPNVVTLSELYNNVLATQITGRLGIEWEQKAMGRSKAVVYELRGVERRLAEAFASRRAEIVEARDALQAAFRERHGRDADVEASRSLDRQAWQTTRQAKDIGSLRTHLENWQARAADVLGQDPTGWAAKLTRRAASRREAREIPMVHADDLAVDDRVDELAREALGELATSRSTWTTSNIQAAVYRATMQVRFASTDDIVAANATITARVEALCVDLTPPETVHTPAKYVRADGTSAFRRTGVRIFTSAALLDAEARLLADGRRATGPVVDLDEVARFASAPDADGRFLADDQSAAVAQIVISGRVVDVLVGPAGTGKTTTLAKLTAAWQHVHGEDSVIGLAPSAGAAQVLGDSLGIVTDNTAKWLTEQRRQPERLASARRLRASGRHEAADETLAEHARWEMRAGSLVIVDEASLAGTLALDALRAQASAAGAKLLLVGDPHQLSAVDAGGGFGLLVADREGTAPELTGVWRFNEDWERAASIRLRIGEASVLDTYIAQDRIHDHDDATEAAYHAWRADEADGKTSLLIAADNATVTALNARARADLVDADLVEARGVALHDGTLAGTGDRIVTRENDRVLSTGRGWVKNGDLWDVLEANTDGSLLVRRRTGGAAITLPAAYVADHVELGYATTAHRAQGATVDTGHVVVDGQSVSMTREVLYVAMTRGRAANHVHVSTAVEDDPDNAHLDQDVRDSRRILADVLARSGASLSATQRLHAEAEADTSLRKMVAEYDTIRRWASGDRYAAFVAEALPGLEPTQLPEWGRIRAALRRIEATTASPEQAIATALAKTGDPTPPQLADALHDLAELLPVVERRTILGAVQADTTTRDADLRRALDERADVIRQHGHRLVTEALTSRATWLQRLGPRPTDPDQLRGWVDRAATIALYRDLQGVTSPEPLGAEAPTSWGHRSHHQAASDALQRPSLEALSP